MQANGNIEGGHLTFARLCSLNLSGKSTWRSLVKMKFESYNIHHCKNNCHKLVFWVFLEQLFSQIIFEQLHCHEVTLVKKYNKPLLQKSETKIFDQKRFLKKLVPSQREKNSGVLRLYQIMPKIVNNKQMLAVKLLANSAVVCNCYIVLNMTSIFTFHISHYVMFILHSTSQSMLLTFSCS